MTRRSSNSHAAACLALVASLAQLGCGGATAGAADPGRGASGGAVDESPAARCLAIATAPRPRREGEPLSVGVAQILVHHRDVKRPAEGVTRSREEACLRAAEALEALRAGADFDDVVARFSDEAGAATRGGRLGSLTRAELVAPFADAAFALEPNQLSEVVESELGFHLVLRTE